MTHKLIKTSKYIYDNYLPSKKIFQHRNNLTEKELEADLFYYNRELIELNIVNEWYDVLFPLNISKDEKDNIHSFRLEYLMQLDFSDFHGTFTINENKKMCDKLTHIMLELQESLDFQNVLFNEVSQLMSNNSIASQTVSPN